MKNLAKAVVAVMKEVKSIKKNSTVGEGRNAYKGVQDMDVKKAIGDAMEKNGLCILPIGVDQAMDVNRWTEDSQYGVKQKQSVFTEVKTKYLLLHESGESIEIVGYGHGIDSQDKSAGKATTYALKYALLYAFMVPTGDIDDTDNTHSDEAQMPPPPKANLRERMAKAKVEPDKSPAPADTEEKKVSIKGSDSPASQREPQKLSLNLGDENWDKVLKFVVTNKDKGLTDIVKRLNAKYSIDSLESDPVQNAFKDAIKS